MTNDAQAVQQEGWNGSLGSETQGHGGELKKGESCVDGEAIQVEVWRTIEQWPSYYISNLGRVMRGGRLIKTFIVKGYLAFNVIDCKRRKSLRVHREVAKRFVSPFSGVLVRHLSGDALDCVASNLAWGNYFDNEADKKRHGTTPYGEKNPSAKLSKTSVLEIRASQLSGRILADKYGVSQATISVVRRGRGWTWF